MVLKIISKNHLLECEDLNAFYARVLNHKQGMRKSKPNNVSVFVLQNSRLEVCTVFCVPFLKQLFNIINYLVKHYLIRKARTGVGSYLVRDSDTVVDR